MQTLLKDRKTAQKKEKHFFSNLLELDFSLKSKEISGKIIEVYIIFLLAVYPLFLFRDNWMGISVKLLLYYAVTVSTLLAAIILGLEQKFEFRKPRELLDYIVLAFGGVNLLLMFLKIINGNHGYRQNLLYMGLAITFYMLESEFVWYRYYTDLFLISGTIVMLWMMIHYLVQPDFRAAGMLLQNQQARSAYMLLIAVTAGAEYMEVREKENDIFYLAVNGAAFTILFLGQSRSFWMLGLCVVTAMPLFFRETAERVKRGAVLIFLYLFLYSNMSLFASYSGLFKIETSFNLMNSVYLDLIIAAAGVVFFHYWDRIPEETDLEEWLLPESRVVLKWCIAIEGIFAAVSIIGADHLKGMEKSGFEKSLCDFAVGFAGEMRSSQNAFLDAIADLGVIGAGFFTVLVIALVRKGQARDKSESPVFTWIAGLLFLVQLFMMPVLETVAPFFAVFGAYALYGKKE